LRTAQLQVAYAQPPSISPRALRKRAASFIQEQLSAMLLRLRAAPCIAEAACSKAGTTLLRELTQAVYDGKPPSFQQRAARAQYTLDLFESRVAFVFEALMSPDPAAASLRSKMFCPEHGLKTLHVSSVGGGPGFDIAAVAFAAAFMGWEGELRGTVFDFEEGWSEVVQTFMACLAEQLASTCSLRLGFVDFAYCDVCAPLEHPVNQNLAANMHEYESLWIFSYVLSENEACLRHPGTPIAKGLGGILPGLLSRLTQHSAHFSSLWFFDTTPRLWPALAATASAHGFEACVPQILRLRRRPREPLLLIPHALGGSVLTEQCKKQTAMRLACHESYSIAADCKRERRSELQKI